MVLVLLLQALRRVGKAIRLATTRRSVHSSSAKLSNVGAKSTYVMSFSAKRLCADHRRSGADVWKALTHDSLLLSCELKPGFGGSTLIYPRITFPVALSPWRNFCSGPTPARNSRALADTFQQDPRRIANRAETARHTAHNGARASNHRQVKATTSVSPP